MQKTVNLLSVVFWLVLSLRFFGVWDALRDAVASSLAASLTVGQFRISLGDVIAFIVALWLGAQLSRFIRFILQEDVFTRVRLPRGVPATISMMVNYGIITIAFFIALAVAGFDLSRFAIIAGALSVGIGFGLQNVVNNFVSGLILAFERPIQVGDSVEVGPLMGRVNRIGIRSSVVRTFDGSEVIVPNADFISKEVINWTLSDVTRRLIIPVGVAYGSNPHQVMDLLVKVAGSHPEVLQEPEPYSLFTEFGDSSLNFELRAWCDFNEGLRVKTELNLAIHDALKEAGIEIPFPQRDLHLRSVDPDAGRNLTPRHSRKGPAPPDSSDEVVAHADTSSIPRSEE
jgi:potassium efflux system protein